MSEDLDLKKTLERVKENFQSVKAEVKGTVAAIRRKEPLPNPIRQGRKRRRERRKKRREQRRQV